MKISSSSENVAILGANSHIAKGLMFNFLAGGQGNLHLFTRSLENTKIFLSSIGHAPSPVCVIEEGYEDFLNKSFDVIINCVGAGTPNKLKGDYSVWFTLTEQYDNLCLDYLKQHPDALYINFSSGAVYGGKGESPAEDMTVNPLCVNHIPQTDYYSIVRLNSEAKHRSFQKLNIVDIRIFAYFSRFIELNSGYFITEAVSCARDGMVFKTGPSDMIRDYIHPDDLFKLILLCIEKGNLNDAFDAISASPAGKFQILELLKSAYGLSVEIDSTTSAKSPNGARNIYCSSFNKAASSISYTPSFTALDAIAQESKHILDKMGITPWK